jgi:hypothetical protein
MNQPLLQKSLRVLTKSACCLHNVNPDTVAEAVRTLSKQHDNSDRFGGVLAIAIINLDETHVGELASETVGKVSIHKVGVYAYHAHEKIRRLIGRRVAGHLDIAASQSAEPNATIEKLRTYGGCIAFRNKHPFKKREYYISFSGAAPEVDEAIAFVIGQLLGLDVPRYENPFIPLAYEILSPGVTRLENL